MIISPVPTHPQSAGNRMRIFSLADNLAKLGHEVIFVHIKKEQGDRKAMSSYWQNRYFEVAYPGIRRSWRTKALTRLKGVWDTNARYLYGLDDWYHPDLSKSIKQINHRFNADVVIVEYIFFSKLLQDFDLNVLKVIDTHDIFTDRHLRYLQNGMPPAWFSTTKSGEAKGISRADVVLAIQSKEKAFFSEITSKKVLCVGHIVRLQSPKSHSSTNNTLLYVGSSNPINSTAINWFIAECFPSIRAVLPRLKLLIAGRVCEKVKSADGIIKLGLVENLQEVYQQADIVINPVMLGTGLKIKNIEALGYAKPLVTTPTGAEGLEDGMGQTFLVAHNASEFIQAVCQLAVDTQLYSTLAKNAFLFAGQWNKGCLHNLNEIISNHTGREKRSMIC